MSILLNIQQIQQVYKLLQEFKFQLYDKDIETLFVGLFYFKERETETEQSVCWFFCPVSATSRTGTGQSNELNSDLLQMSGTLELSLASLQDSQQQDIGMEVKVSGCKPGTVIWDQRFQAMYPKQSQQLDCALYSNRLYTTLLIKILGVFLSFMKGYKMCKLPNAVSGYCNYSPNIVCHHCASHQVTVIIFIISFKVCCIFSTF